MSLMTIPWTLSKRLWARARARGEPSYFIVFSKNARCSSVRGCTYLTIGTSSWGVQSKAKVYIVLDMGRYYTKKLLGGRLSLYNLAQVFRVQVPRQRGRIDQVTKQHGEAATFRLRRRQRAWGRRDARLG